MYIIFSEDYLYAETDMGFLFVCVVSSHTLENGGGKVAAVKGVLNVNFGIPECFVFHQGNLASACII